MTIEELLAQPPIDTMTDAQLEDILRPYFPLTRPTKTNQTPAELLSVPDHVKELVAKHQKPKSSFFAKS